jgi:hypothetical protein
MTLIDVAVVAWVALDMLYTFWLFYTDRRPFVVSRGTTVVTGVTYDDTDGHPKLHVTTETAG